MSANRFGTLFQVTTFGESHGAGLGALIEGCPAGVDFDLEMLKRDLERRRPGKELWVSARKESDIPEVLSGVFENKTLGTPIMIMVRNEDSRSADYEAIQNSPRTGHADDVWQTKFGLRDHRGGGRSSGRETVSRVMAGSVAKMILRTMVPQLQIRACASQIGPLQLSPEEITNFFANPRNEVDQADAADEFVARFPSSEKQVAVKDLLLKARESGESYGGRIELRVQGVPPSLGQPVFHKLKADLASALMGVGASAEFQIGERVTDQKGTQFHAQGSAPYGGIRGGITTGDDLRLSVSMKPTSSILDVAKKGRHDPCIIPRAIPVMEAMTALVLCDHLLWTRLDRI